MVATEFAFNNKVYTSTKSSPFQINYGKEPRMGFDIRKKGKNEKAKEFVREMKEKYKKARVALVKSQKEMKRQADRSRKEVEEYRVGDKILISTKDFLMELMKSVMRHFGHRQFLFSFSFIFLLYRNFVCLFFSFLFSDNEEAHDIAVT